MGISDAYVMVVCDECPNCEEIPLTALAKGAYDMRNVTSAIERLGWKVDGEIITCPDHLEDDDAPSS